MTPVPVTLPTPDTILTPVPERETVWGLPRALSVMVNKPAPGPRVTGEYVTLIWHDNPAPREAPQLFVWPKSPDVTMLDMVREASP